MKTKKALILLTLIPVFFLACNGPLGLGTKLDIEGPVLEFTSPAPRKAVPSQFTLEGTAYDNSGVSVLLIKAERNREAFPRQWRYNKGVWEVSDNFGVKWTALQGAKWNGSEKSGSWAVPVNMVIDGKTPEEGEYLFSAQGWDTGNFSDDNSFKTLVLILDLNPPRVDIISPTLYGKYGIQDDELDNLAAIPDNDIPNRTDVAMIGKFLTQEFLMQWQIEDTNDIWSIDLRFYGYDVKVDGYPDTPLPEDYIYRYLKNTPPPPDVPEPENNIKPNGTVLVPALDGSPGSAGCEGELKNKISEKTTIKAVAVCYDAAGNPNHEKVLGYYIYWPAADKPWIEFTEGMEKLEDYESSKANIEDAFMIYPGRSIKAVAFHAHGVEKITYSLYSYDEVNGVTASDPFQAEVTRENEKRGNGSYSAIFAWEFTPPPKSGYYVIKARAFSHKNQSELYEILFKVQDITFPIFPEPPSPDASQPLFKNIKENADKGVQDSIKISGTVTDATMIESLCLVWINPESRNFAAMSQLQYFRDPIYRGWKMIIDEPVNTIVEEDSYDTSYPNKLWKLNVEHIGEETETRRQIYSYEITINLDALNIGVGKQPLRSQVFLLRAQNPDGKTTIITYAPKGDTMSPVIKITNVIVSQTRDVIDSYIECVPGQYKQIPQFEDGDRITINGTWEEDSAEYLDIQTYLIPNMKFFVNGEENELDGVITQNGAAPNGSFTVEAVIGNGTQMLQKSTMRDTLMVHCEISDIGGNPAEAGASWLVQSDKLRFLRISSETEGSFIEGDEIEIFMEFSKPVQLKRIGNTPVTSPELKLNIVSDAGITEGIAAYAQGQIIENTRQYFTYKVVKGQNTPAGSLLDVIALNNGNDWQSENYSFSWVHTTNMGDKEEIRITASSESDINESTYTAQLPTGTGTIQSLIQNKSIIVDTSPPSVANITATPRGWHTTGVEIYITVEFTKPVKMGDNLPHLNLNIGSGETTSQSADDVRVNNNKITFKYVVADGDTTDATPLEVTGYAGDITDLPGTPFSGEISGVINDASDHLFVKTIAPSVPTVNITTDANGTAGVLGTSGGDDFDFGSDVALKNVYNAAIYLAVVNTEANAIVEYSVNYGTDWKPYTGVIDFNTLGSGTYNITARQTDRAGNVSPLSRPVTLTWDPGNIVDRIDSYSANGDYTYNSVRQNDEIEIQVYFRKQVQFTGTPTITLNATTVQQTATYLTGSTAFAINTPTQQLTFVYKVLDGHTTNGAKLAVTAFNPNGIQDDAGVDISAFSTQLPTNNLSQKEIYVVTGALIVNNTTLAEDGSQLTITFNHNILKGAGNITIVQNQTGYRLPAVLTETQRNTYRSISGFDNYYTKGTNGYNYISPTDREPDTSAKYILDYDVDPVNLSDPDDVTFAEAFRNAERVTLSAISHLVTVSGAELIIDLTGANALQVPGATYLLTYPAGFVQDSLSNQCAAVNTQQLTLSGVARPFVRIKKNQEILTKNAATGNDDPAFLAEAQPFTANVRMDCRTPDSTIYYFVNEAVTTTNARNWVWAGNNPVMGPQDLNDPAAPGEPDDPRTTTANRQEYSNPILIGNDNEYQGLQWFVRAKATTGDGTTQTANIWSADSYEMALRTVVTYDVQNMSANSGQNIGNRMTLWIRGGDAIGSSSVPGFPLTWDDDFADLATGKKRAGIRLLHKRSAAGTGRNNSIYSWVTWEINVDTYFDIMLGNDTDSSAPEAFQYGPRLLAYQRAGWTSFKPECRILPGKHRYLVVDGTTNFGNPAANKGATNFSEAFTNGRGALTPTYGTP